MRSGLESVDGISNIQTDVPSRTCTFELDDETIDITAKLNELADTNEHIAGWIMN